MHCAYCGVDYRPGETCLCAPRDSAAANDRAASESHSVGGIQGKRMLFARLALTRGEAVFPRYQVPIPA